MTARDIRGDTMVSFIEAPVAESYTVVESEHSMFAGTSEPIGILQIAFHACGVKPVVGS